jgi:hypothetical protein
MYVVVKNGGVERKLSLPCKRKSTQDSDKFGRLWLATTASRSVAAAGIFCIFDSHLA